MLTLADKGMWGIIQMLAFVDMGGVEFENGLKYADVMLAYSLMRLHLENKCAKILKIGRFITKFVQITNFSKYFS